MQRTSLRKRFIGDKAFYRTVLMVAVPIMLQNGLTNFVSLLDNIMVGALGTEQMSGVSIVNQLMFVFNMTMFGGLSGAGIYTAQFVGKRDLEGVRNTFRFKFLLTAILSVIGLTVYIALGDTLISLYLHDGGETGDIAATAYYGSQYLRVMLWGIVPFAVTQVYASTLRETGETMLPMKAGIAAMLINLCLNYVLIFGHFGFRAMGSMGAALATVLARLVEMGIVIGWTHAHKEEQPFIVGIYKTLRVPLDLTKDIFRRGMPLLLNEGLWSAGVAILNQSYSVRGLAVVAALNISQTFSGLFTSVWGALGNSAAILVGQELGAGDFDKAEESCWRILGFSVMVATGLGVLLFSLAGVLPKFYNTTAEVRSIAEGLMRIVAFIGLMEAFNNAAYFVLRSGGKTWITFLFDSAYLWAIATPLSWILANATNMPILPMYAIVQGACAIKCILGYVLLKKKTWVNRIV